MYSQQLQVIHKNNKRIIEWIIAERKHMQSKLIHACMAFLKLEYFWCSVNKSVINHSGSFLSLPMLILVRYRMKTQ